MENKKCAGVYTNGMQAGHPCRRSATFDTDYCTSHHPEYRAEIARKRGLRTVAKPGEPGADVTFSAAEMKVLRTMLAGAWSGLTEEKQQILDKAGVPKEVSNESPQ